MMTIQNNTIRDIVNAEVYATNGMPQPILFLVSESSDRIPIATRSWHIDYDGYITWPPTGSYRDNWLADVVGGDAPRASVLRRVISDWLATADLSCLDDLDALEAHRALAASLLAEIRRVDAETNG